jgi:hypothetical protein
MLNVANLEIESTFFQTNIMVRDVYVATLLEPFINSTDKASKANKKCDNVGTGWNNRISHFKTFRLVRVKPLLKKDSRFSYFVESTTSTSYDLDPLAVVIITTSRTWRQSWNALRTGLRVAL